jgi:hypothetical protein
MIPAPRFFVTELALFNMAGERIHSIAAGEPAVIRGTLHSYVEHEQQFLLVIYVIDGDRMTQFVGWQTGTLLAGESYSVSISWIPAPCSSQEACIDYQLRSFAADSFNFEAPHLLAGVVTESISVHDMITQGNMLYRLDLDGKEYEIEYVLGTGDIQRITSDRSLRTLTIELGNIGTNTRLALKLPVELVQRLFLASPADVPIFVDSLPVNPTVHQTEGKITWIISIPEGSTEVELASVIA